MYGDRLPANGAGACSIADPADAVPVVVGRCSGPGCRQVIYSDDEYALCDTLTGEFYCCSACHTAAALKRGEVTRVSDMGVE